MKTRQTNEANLSATILITDELTLINYSSGFSIWLQLTFGHLFVSAFLSQNWEIFHRRLNEIPTVTINAETHYYFKKCKSANSLAFITICRSHSDPSFAKQNFDDYIINKPSFHICHKGWLVLIYPTSYLISLFLF
jgi:hypothetical protein